MITLLLANWKYVAIAALMAAAGSFYHLWRGEASDYNVYRATVAADGRAAKAAAESAKAKQDQITKETSDAIAQALPAIRDNAVANYQRMHPVVIVRQPASSRSVSAVADSAKSADAADGIGVPACAADTELIQSCAAAVGIVQGWQTWALRQGFPLE